MEPKPYYILFAGVNGAGKSTLIQSNLWQHGGFNVTIPRIVNVLGYADVDF